MAKNKMGAHDNEGLAERFDQFYELNGFTLIMGRVIVLDHLSNSSRKNMNKYGRFLEQR